MSAQSSFFNQIVSCTFSESEYERNSASIIAQVTPKSRSKAKEFLETIHEILTVPEYFPMQKFYALSLLVKATKSHNTTLMDQIANSKSFLNKIFKDAQVDKYKRVEEKGRTFFSPNPTEEEADFGNKYMMLLLGAFDYWDREFGTDDEQDPYHCYRAIQSALTDNMSKSFTSSGSRKRSQSPEEFKLRAMKVSSREDEMEIKTSDTKTETEAFKQLKLCIPSMDDYDANSHLVFDKVEKQLAHYNKNLLSAVHSVLSGAEYSSKEKFYALYLVVKLTETNNKAFITQLANEAKLLNKIYALGKNAITKTSSRQRTDDLYQDNLNILILEAAKYWHYAYGSSEPNSPEYSFTYLYQSLKEKGTFPKEYKYIKAIKEDSVVSERRRERMSSSPAERNKREFVEDSGDPISRLIKAYITSGPVFREDYANISCILIKQPAVRSQKYLEETLKIVKSGKATPTELFYAVYLLAKTTESKNSKLITALVECNELVEVLFQDAQIGSDLPPELRGRNFFSKDPSLREATIGSNYVQLVLEMFNFWGKAYGTDDARNPKYVFKTLRNTLEKRTRFVDREYYVGRNLEDIDEEVMEGFEAIPFYELPAEINKKKKELSGIANSLVREKAGNREGGHDQELQLKDLDKKLELLTYSKIILTQFLGTNRKADVDEELLGELINKVITNYKNDVFPYLEYLMKSREQERERYTKKVYEEGRIAEKLEKEYINFSLGKISYLELRKRIIAILTAQSSSSNDSKEDLMEKLHQSMTQSEMVDAPRETRGSRLSSRNSRKGSNSRGTRSPEMEILEDENENGSEDERPTRGRSSVNRSTFGGNRLNSRSREQSQDSKKSKTFSPSRSTTPIRDSMRKSVRDESILSEKESSQVFQEMKVKLEQIRTENQQLNRQNRVLQNEKLEALQTQMKQGNDDAGEIQDLKKLVEEARKKMEGIEREVQIMNERKRREEEMRRAEEARKAKEKAEAEERRKAAEEQAEKEKAEKKMLLMTGKDLSKFIAQRKTSGDILQDKDKEVFSEKKAGSNIVVEPKRDVQQNKNTGQGSILDSFLTGNNRAY